MASPVNPVEINRVEKDALFSRRVAIAVAVAAALSFIVSLVQMGLSDDVRQSLASAPSGFSMSAIGHCATVDFLRASGMNVRLKRTRRLARTNSATAVVVAEPDFDGAGDLKIDFSPFEPESGRQEPIDRREVAQTMFDQSVDDGSPFVLVLPKWRARPVRKREGLWVHVATLVPQGEVAKSLDVFGVVGDSVAMVRRQTGSIPKTLSMKTPDGDRDIELMSPQLLNSDADVAPVVAGPDGILIGKVGAQWDAPLYVISDPDLLNNHGLSKADNAGVFLRFLESELKVRSVIWDEVTHGLQQETPFLAEFVRRPLVYASLHGLFLFALIVWAASVRFGKPLPAPPRLAADKSSLIENTAQLLSHRGRFARSAGRYFDDVVAEVAHSYHLSPDVNLLDELQRLTKQRRLEIVLADLKQDLKPDWAGRSRSASHLLSAARELHRWREGMLHGS